jgi:hypothetical protein
MPPSTRSCCYRDTTLPKGAANAALSGASAISGRKAQAGATIGPKTLLNGNILHDFRKKTNLCNPSHPIL